MERTLLTPEQYLEAERESEERHEYLDGEVRVMPGANEAHCLLEVNVASELGRQVRSTPCRVFLVQMRVRVKPEFYTYPDVLVVSGEPRFLDDQKDTLLNPQLIVEVLSPSTEAYDRGRKFEQYKAIESLREYLLVASDRMHADLYARQADGRWILSSADSLDESLTIESIGVHLRLSELYEKVELAA